MPISNSMTQVLTLSSEEAEPREILWKTQMSRERIRDAFEALVEYAGS